MNAGVLRYYFLRVCFSSSSSSSSRSSSSSTEMNAGRKRTHNFCTYKKKLNLMRIHEKVKKYILNIEYFCYMPRFCDEY